MKNMHNKKLYLYGAGADGKVILCFLHDVNIKVDGVCDKRFETIDSLENVPVISFESTLEEEAVYLITSTKYKKEITEILKNSGKKFYCNLFSLLVFLYMNRLPYYYFYINGSTKTYPRCWLLYRMCNEKNNPIRPGAITKSHNEKNAPNAIVNTNTSAQIVSGDYECEASFDFKVEVDNSYNYNDLKLN